MNASDNNDDSNHLSSDVSPADCLFVSPAGINARNDESDDNCCQQEETLSEQRKKMKRVLDNRRSARNSYLRRKKFMNEIKVTLTDLKERTAALEAENKQLREEVNRIRLLMQENLQRLSQAATPTDYWVDNSSVQTDMVRPGLSVPGRIPDAALTGASQGWDYLGALEARVRAKRLLTEQLAHLRSSHHVLF